MPKIFDTYRFYALTELGEVWYPGFDQRNMLTVENQMSALFRFVGAGVIEGWEVEALPSAVRGEAVEDADLAERESLTNAGAGSFLAFNYEYVGSPGVDDELAWAQIVRVTAGQGIVGLFPAETTKTCYFRLTKPDFLYYAWAEAGLCLADSGRASIAIPEDGDPDHGTNAGSTYLATIETAEYEADPSQGYVYRITYGSNRKQLEHLAGALEDALRRAFYRHVHLGGATHPSKINLSTRLLLIGTGPTGSTILTLTKDGALFTWSAADYGIPVVWLNGNELSSSEYVIDPPGGRISLKNSTEVGDALQVELPLSPQVLLTIHPDSRIGDSPGSPDPSKQKLVYLTDGTTTVDVDGNTVYNIYKWDAGLYKPAQVYLSGDILDPANYTERPDDGGLDFNPPLSEVTYTGDDLLVKLTHIGDEIEGTLSGTRLTEVDAGTFNRGLLDESRLSGLSHLGQTRHKTLASIRPAKRLFSSGDGTTFYPEVPGLDLQSNHECHSWFVSVNLVGKTILLGTDRGLMVSTDGSDNTLSTGFVPDRNRPTSFCDDVLQAGPGTNRFKTLYMLARGGDSQQGAVYLSKNQGASWDALRLPTTENGTVEPTCFYATTERTESDDSATVKTYEYSTLLYLGSTEGLWTATVPEGATEDEWTWELKDYARGEVFAIQEICTLFSQTSSGPGGTTTVESFDRSLYVGADDGFYMDGTKIDGSSVRGFLWVRAGSATNQLFWFTESEAFFTHTGNFESDSADDTTTERWTHPLSRRGTVELVAVSLASTDPLPLAGLDEVDGIEPTDGDRILVKNQSDPAENGVWLAAAGAWSRATDTLLTDCWLRVDGGDELMGSAWLLQVDGGDYNWSNLWWRVDSQTGASYSEVRQAPNTNQFYLLNTAGDTRINTVTPIYGLDGTPDTPSTLPATWDNTRQGEARSVLATSADRAVVATDRGVFLTSDGGESWTRANVQFTAFDSVTVYDTDTNRVNDGFFVAEPGLQIVQFLDRQPTYANYLYEREYVNYYTTPWTSEGADVIVYVDDEISSVPYVLYPDEGRVQFTSSLSPEDEVRITVVRPGAFLSDTGATPHAETADAIVVGAESLSSLAADLDALAAEGTELVLTDRGQVPVDASVLEMRMSNRSERVGVYVNPLNRRVYLSRPRTGNFAFLADLTTVHLVTVESALGIEDYISVANSNQTYHLNSLIGANIARLAIEVSEREAGVFDNFGREPSTGYESDRGLKGAVLFDASSEEFDPRASSSNVFTGLEPTREDSAFPPQTTYCIDGLVTDGEGTRVGTDQGVWIYESGKWRKESSLGEAGRVYFIEDREGTLVAGADTGLWRLSEGTWSKNEAYPQAIFDRDTGEWYGTTFEAFGKDDGLAFVWKQGESFLSDSLATTRGKRVYGLWHSKFIRLKENSAGETTREDVDAVYLCTEDGLYGATNGGVSEQYSQFLTGREMFGANKLILSGVPLPTGGTTSVPVKIYAVFQAPPRPTCDGSAPRATIPILVLTSNGVYRVRNWRWCDPADVAGLIFHPEVHALEGLSCNCYCTTTRPCSTGVEPLSKVFVGTDAGVYRSYNEGASFDRCERVNNSVTAVYFLAVLGDCLVAGTESGIFYSDDDGDSWYRPEDDPLACVNFNRSIVSALRADGKYVAQTFVPEAGQTTVSRVSLYVSAEFPDGADVELLGNNYIQVGLWSTDGFGNPSVALAMDAPPSGVTIPERIYAKDLVGPGFKTVYVPVTLPDATSRYAVVAEEFPATGPGGETVFRFHTSNQSDPYAEGNAATGNPGDWDAQEDVDLFFRVFFNPAQGPTEQDFEVDLREAEGRGFIVSDSGGLTTNFKVAGVFIVDDSRSEGWGDPPDGSDVTRRDKQRDLVDALWNRTRYDDADGTVFLSRGSVYSFGPETEERTAGYTNDPETLKTHVGALLNRGLVSNMNDSANVAVSTLGPQAVIDSVFESADPVAAVDEIVQYLHKQGLLRLEDVAEWFLAQPAGERSAWPWDDPDDSVRANSIKDYADVSGYVVGRWANTYSPVAFLFADGDDDGSQSATNVELTAEASWDEDGVRCYTLGTGRGHRHGDLRTIASSSGGRHSTISSEGDWDEFSVSLLHGGDNSLFSGSWVKTEDFSSPTWVERVNTSYGSDGGASSSVEFRYTIDRANWSAWLTLVPGETRIGVRVLGIEFRITMAEGWDALHQVPVRPYITDLSYTTVLPGRRYFITSATEASGMLFEYLLAPVTDTPDGTVINWGICRGDSTDFSDFELTRQNRKGALPNRQQSAQFTDEVVRSLLATSTVDNQTFQVIDAGGGPASWGTEDRVQVFAGGVEVDPGRGAYSLDNEAGLVIFSQVQPAGLTIRVTITRAPTFYVAFGETTSTLDRRVYRLTNGRWPSDSDVVVLVNGSIARGGYFASPAEGAVTFLREREAFDLVTVYVQPASVFRVGAEMLVYTSSVTPRIEDFALFYTQLANQSILRELQNPDAPEVVNGTLRIAPDTHTSQTRLTVEYNYSSPNGAKERDSLISWWRWREGEDVSGYAEVDIDGFVKISPTNGFTGGMDYENRTVERGGDVGAEELFRDGDRLYVTVTPSDGYARGDQADSRPAITLGNGSPPYVYDLSIASPFKERRDGADYVSAGHELSAFYQYADPDGGADLSIVRWYEKDGDTPAHTGKSLPSSLVISGKVYGFTVTPYDGGLYGNPASSDYITVL